MSAEPTTDERHGLADRDADPRREALAVGVVPCIYADAAHIGKFGHGWATALIDGQPRCNGCLDYLRRTGALPADADPNRGDRA